jgi:hypothetical protein
MKRRILIINSKEKKQSVRREKEKTLKKYGHLPIATESSYLHHSSTELMWHADSDVARRVTTR